MKRGKTGRYMTVRGGMSHGVRRNIGHGSAMTTSINVGTCVHETTIYAWEHRASNAILANDRKFHDENDEWLKVAAKMASEAEAPDGSDSALWSKL